MDNSERVLIYAGPSLDRATILEQIPGAIIRPPIRQSDLISDVMEFEPTHILVTEGCFLQNQSVWHKELIHVMHIPGVKGVYGAASMGALRAADLSDFGMIGVGRIFRWYDEGLITDESEVSALYYERPDGSFAASTVPLVNVRAALLAALEAEAITDKQAEDIFRYCASFHWTERTAAVLERVPAFAPWIGRVDQKKIDALELVCTFRDLSPRPGALRPKDEELSIMFSAQFERDRFVQVDGTPIALQHIDAYICLHDIDYAQKLADSDHRRCALLLADVYNLSVTQPEFDSAWATFCARLGLNTMEAHLAWMKTNNINLKEFCRLMLEEARLKKLRRALVVRSAYRRNTQRLLDYLRINDSYLYWAQEAAKHELRVKQKAGGEEFLSIDLEKNPHQTVLAHLRRTGLTIAGTLENYVAEAGFGSIPELSVALERDLLGAEKEDDA